MPSNWRERKKTELRQSLFETALTLFEDEGYENVTVEQICAAVGVAKGTFFNHFPSKKHVVNEWYDQITVRAIENANARATDSAETAIAELLADMSGQATAAPELMIATHRNHSTPMLLEATRRQLRAVHEFSGAQCERAISQGEMDGDTDVDFFVRLLTSVLSGTSRAWVLTPERFDFPKLIAKRVRFMFRAVKPGSQQLEVR